MEMSETFEHEASCLLWPGLAMRLSAEYETLGLAKAFLSSGLASPVAALCVPPSGGCANGISSAGLPPRQNDELSRLSSPIMLNKYASH